MRHFTDSTTFDVNFLLNGKTEKAHKNNKNRSFNNEAMFDVENLFEKYFYFPYKIIQILTNKNKTCLCRSYFCPTF